MPGVTHFETTEEDGAGVGLRLLVRQGLEERQIRKHFGEEKSVTKIRVGEIESFLRAFAAEKTQWVVF